MASQRHRDSLFWGILLIVVGSIVLLETFHVHIWDYIWKFWPAIFIVWGVIKLSNGLKERAEKDRLPAPQDKGHEI